MKLIDFDVDFFWKSLLSLSLSLSLSQKRILRKKLIVFMKRWNDRKRFEGDHVCLQSMCVCVMDDDDDEKTQKQKNMWIISQQRFLPFSHIKRKKNHTHTHTNTIWPHKESTTIITSILYESHKLLWDINNRFTQINVFEEYLCWENEKSEWAKSNRLNKIPLVKLLSFQ